MCQSSVSFSGIGNDVLSKFSRRQDEESTLTGILGFVADNFSCSESLYTAISATAGRQLLYLIVRDQRVAQNVLQL